MRNNTIKLILLTSMILINITLCFSQIGIRETKEIVKRPSQYDSTSIYIHEVKNDDDEYHHYYKYIGQKIYFVPFTEDKKKSGVRLRSFITKEDSTFPIEKSIPFEETTIFMILSNANPHNSQQKNIENERAKYEKPITTKTNLYKPVIIVSPQQVDDDDPVFRVENDQKALENKEFTIQNIFAGDKTSNKVSLNNRTIYSGTDIIFKLTDSNNDTLYWKTEANRIDWNCKFIIVGAYDKYTSVYKNKTLVYRHQFPDYYSFDGDFHVDYNYSSIINSRLDYATKEYVDIKNGKDLILKDLEEWKCIDVSLLEVISDFDGEAHSYDLYYVLSNGVSEIKIPVGDLQKSGFLSKNIYEKEQEFKKLNAEERARIEKEREQKKKQEQDIYKNKILSKYGQEYGTLILESKVVLGMTMEMCKASWGAHNAYLKNNVFDIWIYGFNSLSFKNGVLVQIVKL